MNYSTKRERDRETELLKQLNNGTYSKVSWPFLLKIKREIFLEVISYGKLQLFKEIFYCLKRNCSFIFKRIRYYDFINESNKRKMWKAIDECLIKCIKIEIQKHTGRQTARWPLLTNLFYPHPEWLNSEMRNADSNRSIVKHGFKF